jgi:hypothetical protein
MPVLSVLHRLSRPESNQLNLELNSLIPRPEDLDSLLNRLNSRANSLKSRDDLIN